MASKGDYTVSTTWADTMAMEDGTTMIQSQFRQDLVVTEGMSPMKDTEPYCTATLLVSADGKPVMNTGACTAMDKDGNLYSYAFRMTSFGVGACEWACGEWRYIDGRGKLKGISGGGTWTATDDSQDGSGGGMWTGSYQVRP